MRDLIACVPFVRCASIRIRICVYAYRRRAGGRWSTGGAPVRERARGRRVCDVEGEHGRAARCAAGRRRDAGAQQAGRARQSALRYALPASALLLHLHLHFRLSRAFSSWAFSSDVAASELLSCVPVLTLVLLCSAAPLPLLCSCEPAATHVRRSATFLVSRASLTEFALIFCVCAGISSLHLFLHLLLHWIIMLLFFWSQFNFSLYSTSIYSLFELFEYYSRSLSSFCLPNAAVLKRALIILSLIRCSKFELSLVMCAIVFIYCAELALEPALIICVIFWKFP